MDNKWNALVSKESPKIVGVFRRFVGEVSFSRYANEIEQKHRNESSIQKINKLKSRLNLKDVNVDVLVNYDPTELSQLVYKNILQQLPREQIKTAFEQLPDDIQNGAWYCIGNQYVQAYARAGCPDQMKEKKGEELLYDNLRGLEIILKNLNINIL